MDPAAMQAKIMELEASLVTATGALQQLSTQQAVHSAPKPPKPPKPDKFQGDRRSGAASNWLHQMTLYLTLSGLLGTAQAVPHAVSFLIGAARTWWRTQEASGSPPTTWTTFKAAFLEAFQTLDAERIARDNTENLTLSPGERDFLLSDKQSFRCHQLGHRAQERATSTTVRPTPS